MKTEQVVKEWHEWKRARMAGYPGEIIWSDEENEQRQRKTAEHTVPGERTIRMGSYIWTGKCPEERTKQEPADAAEDAAEDGAWFDEGGAAH